MTVTEKFKDDSARAAIRALRGLEQTAIMLETWAPEVFPETIEGNGVVQKHFGRIMMESAAESIRQAWADAIKEVENSDLLKIDITSTEANSSELVEALKKVKIELAALVHPYQPGTLTISDWPCENPGDRECLDAAWHIVSDALAMVQP